jgi:hypothetical protein
MHFKEFKIILFVKYLFFFAVTNTDQPDVGEGAYIIKIYKTLEKYVL